MKNKLDHSISIKDKSIFIKMGVRNVFRNQRRSLLTSLIIGLGLATMIITDGYMLGMSENMVTTITQGLVSEGQIHNPQFKDSFKTEFQILNLPQVLQILQSDKNVNAFAERVIAFAMISSPKGLKNVSLYGVDPITEPKITTLNKQIIKGQFVKDKNSLVIGSLLQKRLDVELGDKVVLTLAKNKTGEISQDLFRITGILQAGSKELDEKTIFIEKTHAQKLLGIDNKGIHEMAIKFYNRQLSDSKNYRLWTQLKTTGNLAEGWKKVVSSYVSLMSMVNQSKAIIAFILMFLVAVGIVNTLFMALYERMFEFAVLRALGTKSSEIILMILSEAGSLALLSIVAGIILALCVAIPMSYWGIDYGGLEFAKVTFREPIRFQFKNYQFTLYPLITFVFTLLISLYPAIHATRIKMAEALKRSL